MGRMVVSKEWVCQELFSQLPIDYLVIKDESHQHSGHYTAEKEGASHLSITIVSDSFEGSSKVKRHQLIYKLLDGAFKETLHALSLQLLTPQENSLTNR